MNTFLKKITKDIIYYLLFFLVLQFFISLRIQNISINGHDNLDQVHSKANLIFLGSSRCLTSFDPAIFKTQGLNSVNLGLHGNGSIEFVKYRYLNYIATTHNTPKYAIVTIDPFTTIEKNGSIMKDRFARYCFNANPKDSGILNYFGFTKLEKVLPVYAILKYRKIWDIIFLNNKSTWEKIGMETSEETICSKTNYNLNPGHRGISQDHQLISKLKSLNRLFLSHGTQILIVQIPIYKNSAIHKFNRTKQICSEASVPFLNFCNSEYNDDCTIFADLIHLNKKGAQLISQKCALKIHNSNQLN